MLLVRHCLAFLTAALLVAAPGFAYQSPLSDLAVRDAYFLGKRGDDSLARTLIGSTRFLPPPSSGPYIHSIAFLTPFTLLAMHSSRQVNYSAQQANKEHRVAEEVVVIQVEVFLTKSYGPYLTKTVSSRSDAPTGIEFRSASFWRDIRFHVWEREEERIPTAVYGRPTYSCSEGGCILTGAMIRLEFPATTFTSDSATVEVTPPEGELVSVDFDLDALR